MSKRKICPKRKPARHFFCNFSSCEKKLELNDKFIQSQPDVYFSGLYFHVQFRQALINVF
jgi:hypothetical protein